MAHIQRRWALIAALMVVLPVGLVSRAGAADGPASPLFLTGNEVDNNFNITRIKVVQGGSVINAWDTYGSTLTPVPILETAIAVTSKIKTVGGTECSGACDSFPLYVAEYSLPTGAFIGSSPLDSVPEQIPGLSDPFYDGASDGRNNYAIGLATRNVYSFDSNWENFETLFTLPLFPPLGQFWVGITYDPTNNSIWVSSNVVAPATNVSVWNTIANYSMDGTLLSSFPAEASTGDYRSGGGLALDPADQTLWLVRFGTANFGQFPVRIDQYSKQGAFLGSIAPPEVQSYGVSGAEFQVQYAIGDVNFDGQIDITDVQAITQALNTPVAPGDPRDINGDGRITVLDARLCALRCTNPRCAP